MANDTYTKSLMHMDNVNFTDETGLVNWIPKGDVQISNSTSKFGGTSLFFPQRTSPLAPWNTTDTSYADYDKYATWNVWTEIQPVSLYAKKGANITLPTWKSTVPHILYSEYDSDIDLGGSFPWTVEFWMYHTIATSREEWGKQIGCYQQPYPTTNPSYLIYDPYDSWDLPINVGESNPVVFAIINQFLIRFNRLAGTLTFQAYYDFELSLAQNSVTNALDVTNTAAKEDTCFQICKVPRETWTHVAVQLQKNVNGAGANGNNAVPQDWLTVHVNGKLVFAIDVSSLNINTQQGEQSSRRICMGGWYPFATTAFVSASDGDHYFNYETNEFNYEGYIDEFRVSSGINRYPIVIAPDVDWGKAHNYWDGTGTSDATVNPYYWHELIDAHGSNFIPPTSPFSLITGTQLKNKSSIVGGLR